jgi:hypothetical protein
MWKPIIGQVIPIAQLLAWHTNDAREVKVSTKKREAICLPFSIGDFGTA